MKPTALLDHFFRHEYGRLVATLARRFGVQHLAAVEDAAQSALMAGLTSWTRAGPPDNPSAWLYRVAHNHLAGALRQQIRRDHILARRSEAAVEPVCEGPTPELAGAVQDDLLRMLLVCCDAALPAQSQRVLALKTLCGFDVREIAGRLFMSEAHVYKRLARARARLRADPPDLDGLGPDDIAARRPAVHAILYLLFTEGYLSSHSESAIRRELCDEAIRLTTVLADHAMARDPETCALLALMHLHAARMSARWDETGGLLLLEEQDRRRWDGDGIHRGLCWLAESARGDVYSRYHAEAAVAAEHCLAPSSAETRWHEVVARYARLEQLAPSPMHTLNRAVAMAEWQGPRAGLAVLDGFEPPARLADSYHCAAVLADLHRRAGDYAAAAHHRARAIERAPSPAVAALLRRRLEPTPSEAG